MSYALCLLFFLTSLGGGTGDHLGGKATAGFAGIVISGIVMKLSNVCINISLERDWVSKIGSNSSEILTKLNTWLRRLVSLHCSTFRSVNCFVSRISLVT